MFSRVSQLARHLSRPSSSLPNVARTSSAVTATRRGSLAPISITMATADERNTRTIRTAACLIIGDEVLGGKTRDTNSNYMAKWCFSLGINLKRVEVIADDEEEIAEAVRRMSEKYDFVVTSGGIGPTHDDITYPSIAKAFNLPLILHEETLERMKRLSRRHADMDWDVDSAVRRARYRMAELPTDTGRDTATQFLFTSEDLWVPVVVANGNVHILPGIPRLFEGLLEGLKAFIIHRLIDPDGKGIYRVLISTPMPESDVAGYLTELAARVEPKDVKVGSYPRWGKKRNTVTLVGKDKAFLDSITPEVVQNVKGRVVMVEGEDDELPDEVST